MIVPDSWLWRDVIPPLVKDDPLFDWINRGFDLYGGLGRCAAHKTARDPNMIV